MPDRKAFPMSVIFSPTGTIDNRKAAIFFQMAAFVGFIQKDTLRIRQYDECIFCFLENIWALFILKITSASAMMWLPLRRSIPLE